MLSFKNATYPIVHDGSDPPRILGMWIVPNLWKLSNSIPSFWKGISHRIWDPLNNSADPLNGALGVRLKFCLPRVGIGRHTVLASKIDTKFGLWQKDKTKLVNKYKFKLIFINYMWWLLPQWSSGGSESKESGVALLDLVPVLDVSMSLKTSRISGLRWFRFLCRPRTVRFKAFTLCFTASAWLLDNPTSTGVISAADNSRPWNKSVTKMKLIPKILRSKKFLEVKHFVSHEPKKKFVSIFYRILFHFS